MSNKRKDTVSPNYLLGRRMAIFLVGLECATRGVRYGLNGFVKPSGVIQCLAGPLTGVPVTLAGSRRSMRVRVMLDKMVSTTGWGREPLEL